MKARCVSSAISNTRGASAWSKVGGIGGGPREWAFPARRSHRRRSSPAGASNLRVRSGPIRRLQFANLLSDLIQRPRLPDFLVDFVPRRHRRCPILLSEHLSPDGEIAPVGASRMQRLPYLISSFRSVSPRAARAHRRQLCRNYDITTPSPYLTTSQRSTHAKQLSNLPTMPNDLTTSRPHQTTSQHPGRLRRPGPFSSRDTTNASSDWRLPQR